MFYSREKEIEDINKLFENSNKTVLLYGKRRVGKTELITHIFKDRKSVYFECIKDTIEENVRLFVNECKKAGINIPDYARFSSFVDIFDFFLVVMIYIACNKEEYCLQSIVYLPRKINISFRESY